VEHPVTEAVTGLDLVHLQLRVAAGEPLPFTQDQISQRGHAVEGRVCAEDPAQDFLPSSGRLWLAREPHGPGVRVDAGFQSGDEIPPHYDSLLAKVIAYAPTRPEALARAEAALARYTLLGPATNVEYLRAVLTHPQFTAGAATTQFVQEQLAGWRPAQVPVPEAALAALALADWRAAQNGRADTRGPAASNDASPWARSDGFRLGQGRGAGS